MWAHPLFIAKCARERFFENFDVFKLKRGCVTLRRNIPSVESYYFQAEKVVGEKLLTYSSYWHKSACFLTIFLKKSQKKILIHNSKQIRITPTMLIT